MEDTQGASAARAALGESVGKNRQEVALAGETIALIRSEIRLAVAEGIAEGLPKALTEENAERLFTAFFTAMQRQAAARTGNFVLGGLRDLARKAFWAFVLLALLYNFGGWTAVKAGWSALQIHNGG